MELFIRLFAVLWKWQEVENEAPYLAPTKRETNTDDCIVDLVDALTEIDECSQDAELNQVSMADSKGNRIYF